MTHSASGLRARGTGTGRRISIVAALLVAGLGAAACGSDEKPPVSTTAAASPSATGAAAEAPKPSITVTASPPARGEKARLSEVAKVAGKVTVTDASIVAQATGGSVKVYGSPADTSPDRTLSPQGGVPLVFHVQERRDDWLRVLLPVRPNQSQGWIKLSEVKLLQHTFRITISRSRHELTLFKSGKVVMREPVGLGTGTTPTPGGVFYTKELLKPPKANGPYGPYAYGLSGFSEVLTEFLGGDGTIGIHGTNEPGSVGKNVSHGCIRMRNAAITKLAGMLPLGVPVQIVK